MGGYEGKKGLNYVIIIPKIKKQKTKYNIKIKKEEQMMSCV